MLGVALLYLVAADSPAKPLTFAEIDGKSPQELAARLFPPEVGAEVADGKVGRIFGPGHQYGVRLWTAARPVDGLFCHRRLHATTVEDWRAPWTEKTAPDMKMEQGEIHRLDQYATTWPAAATVESCAKATGYIGPREEQRAAAMTAVRQLVWAMEAAQGTAALPFEVECRDEDAQGKAVACPDGRAALAALPLPAMFRIDFDTGRYEQVPGMSAGIIRQKAPTAEHPAVPTVRFGPYGDGGKSWFATLEHRNGHLAAVRLRRSTVIYH